MIWWIFLVKEQFINTFTEDLALYLLEGGRKNLEELTTWSQKYLIVHKQQLDVLAQTFSPDMQMRRNRHSLNQIRHKDARGRFSATCVNLLNTGNQIVLQRLVPARLRRVCQHK